jgi:HK97 family phage major capsid protein
MKISERINQHVEQRGKKAQALADLLEKSEKDGRAMTDDERAAFDETEKDIKAIDETMSRLRELEAIQLRTAQPVNQPRIEVVSAAKGIRFARMCQAIAASRGNLPQALEISKMQWPDDKDIHNVIRAQSLGITRAAVAAGTTTDPAWAGALVSAQQMSSELIELVMKEAVIGQLTQMRRVPFNVRIPREVTAVGSAKWVGQGASKPVGKGAYDFITIPWAKAALIVVITEELARFSNPAAETLMRDSLVRAVTDFLNDQFVGSGIAPVANVSPGGITNGLPVGQTFASSGESLAAIQYDLTHAVSLLHDFNAPRAPTWIMHPQNLIYIAATMNAFGQPAFPTAPNKSLMGYPVVTSSHLDTDEIILLDQADILFAGDDSVTVDVSREASVQMDDTPATPATPLLSFWQQNLIGLRGEMFAYWQRARDKSVVLITGVGYGQTPPAPALANGAPAAQKAPAPQKQAAS